MIAFKHKGSWVIGDVLKRYEVNFYRLIDVDVNGEIITIDALAENEAPKYGIGEHVIFEGFDGKFYLGGIEDIKADEYEGRSPRVIWDYIITGFGIVQECQIILA